MLETIARSAAAEDVNNIRLLQLDWTQAKLGVDFEQHDVVLVSRSLPAGKDILRCLNLINSAARRLCYVTWKVDGHDALEAELCRTLGVDYRPSPAAVCCAIYCVAWVLSPAWRYSAPTAGGYIRVWSRPICRFCAATRFKEKTAGVRLWISCPAAWITATASIYSPRTSGGL